jgi:hypothetical protein
MNKYNDLLNEPKKKGIKNSHIAGFFFGYAQFVRFGFIACVFYIASLLIYKLGLDPQDTYISIYVLFTSALGSGVIMSNVPSLSKARAAA